MNKKNIKSLIYLLIIPFSFAQNQSSDKLKEVKIKSKELTKLNNKRKEIERLTLDEIDFKKIEKDSP